MKMAILFVLPPSSPPFFFRRPPVALSGAQGSRVRETWAHDTDTRENFVVAASSGIDSRRARLAIFSIISCSSAEK